MSEAEFVEDLFEDYGADQRELNGKGTQGPAGKRGAGDEAGDAQLDKDGGKRATIKRKRPKLTATMLRQPEGLIDVFQNFPKFFASGFGGKGHEVRDLRRLIELYQRWQHRIFPHGTFDSFQGALERLSSSAELRSELRTMREGLAKLVDPPVEEALDPEEAWRQAMGGAGPDKGAGGSAGQAGPGGGGQGRAGGGGGGGGGEGPGDLDDDELLALQAEDQWDAAMDAVPEAFGETPGVPAPSRGAATAAAAATTIASEPAPRATTAAGRRVSGGGIGGGGGGGVSSEGGGDLEDEDLGPPVGQRSQPARGRRAALADWSDDDDDDEPLTFTAPARKQPLRQQSSDPFSEEDHEDGGGGGGASSEKAAGAASSGGGASERAAAGAAAAGAAGPPAGAFSDDGVDADEDADLLDVMDDDAAMDENAALLEALEDASGDEAGGSRGGGAAGGERDAGDARSAAAEEPAAAEGQQQPGPGPATFEDGSLRLMLETQDGE